MISGIRSVALTLEFLIAYESGLKNPQSLSCK